MNSDTNYSGAPEELKKNSEASEIKEAREKLNAAAGRRLTEEEHRRKERATPFRHDPRRSRPK